MFVLDHLIVEAPFNIKFGGGGRLGPACRMFLLVLHDRFGGAIFCPSTVKMMRFLRYDHVFVHDRMTLRRRAESVFVRRISFVFSCRSALASHASHSGQAPVSARFAAPQPVPEALEGGDPLSRDVAQRGRHGSF